MKLQRAGNALLTDARSPLLGLLAPAILSSSTPASFRQHPTLRQGHAYHPTPRWLSTTSPRRAATSPARKVEESDTAPDSTQAEPPRYSPQPGGTPRAQPPKLSSRPLQSQQQAATSQKAYKEALGSLLAGIKRGEGGAPGSSSRAPLAPNPSSPSSSSSADLLSTPTSRRQSDLARTHLSQQPRAYDPGFASPIQTQQAVLEIAGDASHHLAGPAPPPMRLDAYMGRAEAVTANRPLPRALAMLTAKITLNQVRATFNKQKFHERGGLKRKRLRKERWRKRFKEGFVAMVGKVQHMRRQGW